MRKLLNAPNTITLLRGLLLAPTLYYLFQSKIILASILIILNVFMDYFDGYLARTLNQETEIGKKLDPIVDGVFSVALLLSLFFLDYISIMVVLIIIFSKLISLIAGVIHVRKGKKKIPLHHYFHRPIAGFIFISLLIVLIFGNVHILFWNSLAYFVVSLIYLYLTSKT